MSIHNQRFVVTGSFATALLGVVGYLWLIQSRKRSKSNTCVSDIKGNFHAKGSEVAKIYKSNIPGKTYIITGATSGLGKHVAMLLGKAAAAAEEGRVNIEIAKLLKEGAGGEKHTLHDKINTTTPTHIILGVRNLELGYAVQKEILAALSSSSGTNVAVMVDVVSLDLSSFRSVQSFVSNVLQKTNSIDGIINNAGAYGLKGNSKEDDLQLTWQTNAVSPALLTELFLPYLSKDARIVHVSSKCASFVRGNIPNQCPVSSASATTDGSTMQDYALSKACQILHAMECNHRFGSSSSSSKEKNINSRSHPFAIALEPGIVETNILRNTSSMTKFINFTMIGKWLQYMKTLDEGCSTILFCLLAPVEEFGGEMSINKNTYHYYYCADCEPCMAPSYSCQDLQQAHDLQQMLYNLWKTKNIQLPVSASLQ